MKAASADLPSAQSTMGRTDYPHALEELFVHDLAVGDFAGRHLFHRESSGLRLKRDGQFECHREVRARDQRTLNSGQAHFVVSGLPFALSRHGLNLAQHSGRGASLRADDVGRVEGFQNLLELALRAEIDERVRNILGSPDRSPIQLFRGSSPKTVQA